MLINPCRLPNAQFLPNLIYGGLVSNRWVVVYVGGASGVHFFLGELSWGSGFIYIFPYPHILNISNGENGSLALHNPSKFH